MLKIGSVLHHSWRRALGVALNGLKNCWMAAPILISLNHGATVFQKTRFARQKLVDKIFHPSRIMLRNQESLSNDEFVVVTELCRACSLEDVKVRAMAMESLTDRNDFGRRPTSHIQKSRAFPTCHTSKIAYLDVIMA
jgi:hypothetical protein